MPPSNKPASSLDQNSSYRSTPPTPAPPATNPPAATPPRAQLPKAAVVSASRSGSQSSTDASSMETPMSSTEPDTRPLAAAHIRDHNNTRHHHHQHHSTSSRDPEKADSTWYPRYYESMTDIHNISLPYDPAGADDDGEDVSRRCQEEHAAKILVFLSLPCVLLSFVITIWTLIALLIATLALPFRLCTSRSSFGHQLASLLGPALMLQLKCIYTPVPSDSGNYNINYRPLMLVAVQLVSPILSLGMTIAAWVVAVFWLSSAVVGDPAGTDRGDDGRETVLTLRRLWESWLLRSVSDE